MTAISNRSPLVAVEYDSPKGRTAQVLADPYAARRLYAAKLKAGKNPTVMNPDKLSHSTTKDEAMTKKSKAAAAPKMTKTTEELLAEENLLTEEKAMVEQEDAEKEPAAPVKKKRVKKTLPPAPIADPAIPSVVSLTWEKKEGRGCNEFTMRTNTGMEYDVIRPAFQRGSKTIQIADTVYANCIAPEVMEKYRKLFPSIVAMTWDEAFTRFTLTASSGATFGVSKLTFAGSGCLLVSGRQYVDDIPADTWKEFDRLNREKVIAQQEADEKRLATLKEEVAAVEAKLAAVDGGGEKLPRVKKEKVIKPAAERDNFGNRIGCQSAAINAKLLELVAAGKKKITHGTLALACDLSLGRIQGHVKYLVDKGFVTVKDGSIFIKGSEPTPVKEEKKAKASAKKPVAKKKKK